MGAALESLRSHVLPQLLRGGSPTDDPVRRRDRPTFSPKPRPTSPSTFRVRVDIDEARPSIWRRLELAGDLTLHQVHRVLLATFGWHGYHLHKFTPEFGGQHDLTGPGFATGEFEDDERDLLRSEHEVRLVEVVAKPGDRLFYEYDFGDGWIHTLKVEHVRARGDEPAAACIGGRRAGPPEDCGGIWRYNDIVAALDGNDTVLDADELDELREWLGEDFDPADADLEDLADLDAVAFGRPWSPAAKALADEVVAKEGADDDVVDDDLHDLHELFTEGERAFWLALPANPRLAKALRELIEEADIAEVLEPVGDLISAADLDVTGTPIGAPRAALFASLPAEEADAVTRPWRDVVTAVAGGLPGPVSGDVQLGSAEGDDAALFTLQWAHGSSSSATPDAIAAAAQLGLVRQTQGRFLTTKAGRVAGGDPIRMWRHLADRLTAGLIARDRLLAAMALLAIAADDPAHPVGRTMAAPLQVFDQTATALLPRLGFLGVGWFNPTVDQVHEATRTVWDVFRISGGLDPGGRATEAGRRLARAALLE